jgi:proteasome lid subunit RPN8/RPN11
LTRRVELPPALAAAIAAAAAGALPHECCGLLEGTRDDAVFRVTALHPARNLSGEPERFQIDPADHFKAQKAARANGRAIIGCYHSHPHGAAQPSAADLAGAQENDFLWLIAGQGALNAFVYLDGVFRGCVTGADWVTSSE